MDYGSRLIRFKGALAEIAMSNVIDKGDRKEAFRLLTQKLVEALDVERASIWLYDETKSSIVLSDLFELKTRGHSEGMVLKKSDFPVYFSYLQENRVLVVEDARGDKITSEFTEPYLKPLNIFSMLDAPIRVNGEVVGVICNEKVGSKIAWTVEDDFFVCAIADLIGRVLEAEQRVLAEKQLQAHQVKAVQSAKLASLGEMAGGVAHEINNPLQVIISAADFLRDLVADENVDRDALKESVAMISNTAQRIDKIVKGLKYFAREGSLEQRQRHSLTNLFDDTLSFCRERFASRGVKLHTPTMSTPIFLRINAIAVSQVLLNLLNNSFDAVVGSREAWVRLELDVFDGLVQISVTDSGPGIPADLREKIMNPFFTTKPVGIGTGLGLSVSKGLVESHGGKLYLDHTCKNTRFVIELPRDLEDTFALAS